MKGEIDLSLYLFLIVVIGLVFVSIVAFRMNPLSAEKGRSMELAIMTGMHIDALSTVREGEFSINTGDYKYDIEVQKKDSIWRTVGNFFTNSVLKNGYYIAVSAYKKDGTKADPEYFLINSYKLDKTYPDDLHVVLEKTNSLCISKKADKEVAEVVKCA